MRTQPVAVRVILDGLHKGEIYLAKPPIAVQKALFELLAAVGKLLGYRDEYPKYSETDTPSGEGAGPPSTTTVVARGASAATVVLVASLLLLARIRHPSKR